MKTFRNGVSHYTVGTLKTEINFPEDDVCCGWCDYLDKITRVDRYYCRVNKKTIYNPDRLAEHCPLIFEEETK